MPRISYHIDKWTVAGLQWDQPPKPTTMPSFLSELKRPTLSSEADVVSG